VSLSSFELGKLKIAAHVREELDRAGISAETIKCRSDGTQISPRTARVTIVVNGTAEYLDLKTPEVEECELIVAGEPWHKIAALIGRFAKK
jgi:hypothetical protein